jgi:6-pyruvoyltetrahydropterin/6-carboxytetrahydropterin synthase
MITIGKRFTFDAAHRLGRHEGKCGRPHGHTYILEIDFTGPVKTENTSDQGMVLDYYEITQMVNEKIMAKFDHQDLNQVMRPYFPHNDPEVDNVTTAEAMVHVFVGIINGWLQENPEHTMIYVTRVRLQETQSSWAEWREEN